MSTNPKTNDGEKMIRYIKFSESLCAFCDPAVIKSQEKKGWEGTMALNEEHTEQTKNIRLTFNSMLHL
jgi:hypothetical protein